MTRVQTVPAAQTWRIPALGRGQRTTPPVCRLRRVGRFHDLSTWSPGRGSHIWWRWPMIAQGNGRRSPATRIRVGSVPGRDQRDGAAASRDSRAASSRISDRTSCPASVQRGTRLPLIHMYGMPRMPWAFPARRRHRGCQRSQRGDPGVGRLPVADYLLVNERWMKSTAGRRPKAGLRLTGDDCADGGGRIRLRPSVATTGANYR